ncbi:DUF1643 domain-containing protein [Bacillus sp. JJ1609]|uniref:DUF1643 domain-containing protein n=1 Tax=Bacillus sp. JJ1609 TaxID=3122977 RepID=UPI002FFED3B8
MSKVKHYYNLINVEPQGYIPDVGLHRFLLQFKTKKPHGGRSVAVIQMNGAKAGPTKKGISKWNADSTIGKVLTWCYENPATPFEVVYCLNLFSYVDPKSEHLSKVEASLLNSPLNDFWIREACSSVDQIIIAYGDCKGIDIKIVNNRIKSVLHMLTDKNLFRVGDLTKKGNPRHGRSWNNNPQLVLHKKAQE